MVSQQQLHDYMHSHTMSQLHMASCNCGKYLSELIQLGLWNILGKDNQHIQVLSGIPQQNCSVHTHSMLAHQIRSFQIIHPLNHRHLKGRIDQC